MKLRLAVISKNKSNKTISSRLKEVSIIVLFLTIDIFVYYLSILLGYKIRHVIGQFIPQLPEFIIPLNFIFQQIWIPAVLIISFFYSGLYTKIKDFWGDLEAILKSFFFSTILIFSIISFIKFSDRLSRLHLIISFFIFFMFLPAFRYIFKILLNKTKLMSKKVLIVGVTDGSCALAKFIQNNNYLSYQVIGFWDKNHPNKRMTIDGYKFKVFRIKNLEKIIQRLGINSLILSEPYASSKDFLLSIRNSVKNILLIPSKNPFFIYSSFLFSSLYSDSLVLHFKNNLCEPFNILIKRIFDIVVSLTFLLFLFPFMVLIAILIKIDSPGPVIFSQPREGQNKKKILIYKFRTMYINSDAILNRYLESTPEAKKEWLRYRKLKNDPRITRIGKFLRKTSLDEIPQLFNVLKGEMSLVGPRPVTKEEIDTYYKEFADFYYEVKPGLTGLWQVSGKNKLSYEKRVFLDVMYAINWSIWRDIIILVKTIPVVFQNEG